MASLNQIAESIAISKDQQNNVIFKENIKFRIKQLRGLLIRRDIEKNGDNINFFQSYTTPLEKVDKFDTCLTTATDNCYILRTPNKIPTPLKTKNNVPFSYVGNLDKSIIFSHGKLEHEQFVSDLEFSGTGYRYDYIDGYVYIKGNFKFKFLRIDARYENPELVSNNCTTGGICYDDDMEFPCSSDMISEIIDILIKEGLSTNYVVDNQIVETNEN